MRPLAFAALLGLVSVTFGASAGAQTTASSTHPTTETPESLETARRLFHDGVDLADQGRWAEARERFARVLAIRDAPLVRFNLALASERSGRLIAAIEQYRVFLSSPDTHGDPVRRAVATRAVESLSARLARLHVHTTGDTPAVFSLDGRSLPLALLDEEITVDPGHHVVVIDSRHGDQQRYEGTLLEAERARVTVTLTARRDVAAQHNNTPARPRAFGHWITRPDSQGRWIDSGTGDRPEPTGPYFLHPVTLSLGGGYGWSVGTVAVSARWFALPWFGGEITAGYSLAQGFGAGVFAHLRWLSSSRAIFTPSLFFGPTLHATPITTECTLHCTQATTTATVPMVGLSVGLAGEFRLGDRLALRLTAGVRTTLNPGDFRAAVPTQHTCSTTGALAGVRDVCETFTTADDAHLGPFITLDLGWRP